MLGTQRSDISVRWSAGSLRADHPEDPYWRVSSAQNGLSGRIPGRGWPDGPPEYTVKDRGCTGAYTLGGFQPGDDLLSGNGGDDGMDPFGEYLYAYIFGGCPATGLLLGEI